MNINEQDLKYIIELITKKVIEELKRKNFIIEPDFKEKQEESIETEQGYEFKGKVLTEEKLRRKNIKYKIFIDKKTIITPSAKDYCKLNNIELIIK